MNQYSLEMEKAIRKIRESKAKLVCIQLPDGLKPRAQEIADEINSKTGAKALIWLGSCFGSCDLPQGLERPGVDLLISWGHKAGGWTWK